MTDLTPERLAELRAVAEAATDGSWEVESANYITDIGWATDYGIKGVADLSEFSDSAPWHMACYPLDEEDATYIATFDPPTTLALIDALEGLSTTNENLVAYARKAEAALEAKTAEVDAKADYVSDLEGRVRQRDNHVIPVLHARIKEAERERDEARAGMAEADQCMTQAMSRAEKAERLTPKQPDGWSTQDRQEAKQEAERRWTDDWDGCQSDFDRGGINGFILGAEWQKARETFISYKTIADRAEAALERVRALHRKAHAIFSWSEGGVRYEEPCENCNGAPGVHDCGCWADEQVEYVCAECDRGKGKHRDSGWPCPTVQAIEGADNA